MSLIIELTPAEEAQLSAAARETGMAPADFVKRLVREHLPVASPANAGDLDARLRKWQEQDNTSLLPDVPAKTLFERWAQEDALMTDEEREAEDRLWQELEKELSNGSRLQLRRLS